MSFFQKSDGSAVEKKNTASVGGFQKLIPDGTQLQCAIAGAVWAEKQNKKVVLVTLHVTEPGTYRNFKVDHALKVFDDKDKTRDAALDMLMTYDTLCKGELAKADAAGKSIVDNNPLLARALNGGVLIATFAEYEFKLKDRETGEETGEVMTGNWVRGIAPKPGAREEAKAADVKAESQGFREPGSDDDLDIF